MALTDPALLAEAKKIKLPIDVAIGEEVEAEIRTALAQPPAAIELLRQATLVDTH